MIRTLFIGIVVLVSLLASNVQARDLKAVLQIAPLTYDPQLGRNAQDADVASLLFPKLFDWSKNGELEPSLVRDFDYDSASKTYRLELRPDLKWSDGAPLTANDVVFSIRRYAKIIRSGYPDRTIMSLIDGFDAAAEGRISLNDIAVRALTPSIVEIQLNKRSATFVWKMIDFHFSIVPQHAVEQHGERWTEPEHIVTGGPFVLLDRDQNLAKFSKNLNYFAANEIVFDGLQLYFASPEISAMRLAQEFDVDVIVRMGAETASLAKRSMPNNVKSVRSLNSERLNFNIRLPPMNDVRVRRAIALAIDPEGVAERARLDVDRSLSLLPWRDETAQPELLEDLEIRRDKAKALLQEAGFDDENPLRIVLATYQQRGKRTYVRYIVDDLRRIGIDVTFNGYDTYLEMLADIKSNRIHVYVKAWGSSIKDPGYFLIPAKKSKGLWDLPSIETKINRALNANSLDEREQLSHEILDLFVKEYYAVPLFSPRYNQFLGPDVRRDTPFVRFWHLEPVAN